MSEKSAAQIILGQGVGGRGGRGGEGEEEIAQVCVCMRSVNCLENARVFQLWGFLVIRCPRWRRSWKKRSLQERVGTVV